MYAVAYYLLIMSLNKVYIAVFKWRPITTCIIHASSFLSIKAEKKHQKQFTIIRLINFKYFNGKLIII